MEVDTFNATRDLIEGDVIEALKTGPTYRPHGVIRYKKVLFPAHEQMLLLHPIF